MVVLKKGDWVLDDVGGVGRVESFGVNEYSDLIKVRFMDGSYLLVYQNELTKLDEALYKILSDSIREE